MCECPSGDFNAEFRLPGPEGTVYALQRYLGCRYCNTPAAVIVHRFSLEEAKRWRVNQLPELTFDGIEIGDAWLRVLDPEILKRRLVKWAEEVNADEEYDMEGAMQDGVDSVLFDALRETVGAPEPLGFDVTPGHYRAIRCILILICSWTDAGEWFLPDSPGSRVVCEVLRDRKLVQKWPGDRPTYKANAALLDAYRKPKERR